MLPYAATEKNICQPIERRAALTDNAVTQHALAHPSTLQHTGIHLAVLLCRGVWKKDPGAALFLRLLKQHEFCPHWNAPDYVPDPKRPWSCSGDCDLSGLGQVKQEEAKSRAVNIMLHIISNHPKRVFVNVRSKVRSWLRDALPGT